MSEQKMRTVRLGLQFMTEATQVAGRSHRSAGAQIEYWAKLGRAVEASAAFSTADINAVLAGSMKIEALNHLEQAAFVERLPETFHAPSAELVAAYGSLSDDPATGLPQYEDGYAVTRRTGQTKAGVRRVS